MKKIFKNFAIFSVVIISTVLIVFAVDNLPETWEQMKNYTWNSGETMTADHFNELVYQVEQNENNDNIMAMFSIVVDKVKDLEDQVAPSGAVMAFYRSECPTGWIEADGSDGTVDLRGTFIRGINGEKNNRDVVRALGGYQEDAFKSHNHDIILGGASGHYLAESGSAIWRYDRYMISLVTKFGGGANAGISGTENRAHGDGRHIYFRISSNGDIETRPKNVALLYCQKQ